MAAEMPDVAHESLIFGHFAVILLKDMVVKAMREEF